MSCAKLESLPTNIEQKQLLSNLVKISLEIKVRKCSRLNKSWAYLEKIWFLRLLEFSANMCFWAVVTHLWSSTWRRILLHQNWDPTVGFCIWHIANTYKSPALFSPFWLIFGAENLVPNFISASICIETAVKK